jgi:signal transduction histidine kinase/ActR/RegA family two-component response regulator
MLKVAVAQCEAADTLYGIQNVIHSCVEQLHGNPPQFGILYAQDELDHQLMLEEVMKCFPDLALAGCVGAGDMSSAYGFSEDSISLMLVCCDTIQVTVGCGENVSTAPGEAVRDAMSMAAGNHKNDLKLCLAFADGVVGKHVDILKFINVELPESCQVFGGMSGIQRMHLGRIDSAQFCNGKVLKDAIVLLLFSGEIECSYSLCNSWKTVGQRTQVTEVNGLSVVRIGDQSALDFYRYYLGSHTQPAIENPFAVYNDAESSDFYLRVPVGYDEKTGSISFPAPVPEGTQVQITESNKKQILHDLQGKMKELQDKSRKDPSLALLFSCDIRKNILGTSASDEFAIVEQLFASQIPTLGVYTYGEIAPQAQDSRSIVHHCTLVGIFITFPNGGLHAAEDGNGTSKYNVSHQARQKRKETTEERCHSDIVFMEKRLQRERFFREQLEVNKEINVNIFRKINGELQDKNEELKCLNVQIQEARDTLEKRVADRTRELVLSNRKLEQEIEERTKMFKEKQSLESKLFHVMKMETVGTMAGGIAHDFNNILSPIMGYTEVVARTIGDKDENYEYLLNVLKAARRAKELVRQILLFSRKKEYDPQLIQVQHILKEALKLIRSSLPSSIHLQLDLDSECGFIMAEPTQIHQVLMNLCTNAAYAMKEQGGRLTVRLTEETITGTEEGTADLKSGTYVCLQVSDTGTGMETKVAKRIFEPYFTTKPVGEGTGMGLSMVHGIVQGHNGSIQVSSERGCGTAFKVFLPVLVTAGAHAKCGDSAAVLPTGNEHILLVDDDSTIVNLYCSILEGLGYQVTGVCDSIEALALFEERPSSFDLVISDHTMPGLTGRKLVDRMLHIRPDIPVILMSGFDTVIVEREPGAMGIRKCLDKPVGMKEIAESVRQVLDEGW